MGAFILINFFTTTISCANHNEKKQVFTQEKDEKDDKSYVMGMASSYLDYFFEGIENGLD